MTITLFNTLLFWVDIHYVLGLKIYTRCSDITHSTNTLSALYVLNTTLIYFDNWTKDRFRINVDFDLQLSTEFSSEIVHQQDS